MIFSRSSFNIVFIRLIYFNLWKVFIIANNHALLTNEFLIARMINKTYFPTKLKISFFWKRAFLTEKLIIMGMTHAK